MWKSQKITALYTPHTIGLRKKCPSNKMKFEKFFEYSRIKTPTFDKNKVKSSLKNYHTCVAGRNSFLKNSEVFN